MRTITVHVLKDPKAARPMFCGAHAPLDATAAGLAQPVPSVVGRLTLRGGGCWRCACDALAAGRAVLAPEGINALGGPVALADLRDHGVASEREFMSALMAASEAAGVADLDVLLRALRRAQGHPDSPETRELAAALRSLLGPFSEPCCTAAAEGNTGVFRSVKRWREAA